MQCSFRLVWVVAFGALVLALPTLHGCAGEDGASVFHTMCETVCARGAECIPDTSIPECMSLCMSDFEGIPCNADQSLLDQCVAEIDAVTCAEFTQAELPAVCAQVCIGDCRTDQRECFELTYCDETSGDCLPGCADDAQCSHAQQTCNTDTHECECLTGLVLCDDACIPEIRPTLTAIQPRVFEPNCVLSACHGGDQPQLGLDLGSVAAAESSLVSVNSVEVPTKLRVAPGDSSASYIVNKLLGVDMAVGTEQMPFQGTPLCDARIDAIRAWIDAGAPTE